MSYAVCLICTNLLSVKYIPVNIILYIASVLFGKKLIFAHRVYFELVLVHKGHDILVKYVFT